MIGNCGLVGSLKHGSRVPDRKAWVKLALSGEDSRYEGAQLVLLVNLGGTVLLRIPLVRYGTLRSGSFVRRCMSVDIFGNCIGDSI